MEKYDYLIIGGGIAGVTAAETIREGDPNASIAIISEELYPLYSRVLLPAYLKKRIAREQLFLRKTDNFLDKKIELFLGERVSFVDINKKEVGSISRTIFGYEKLLIASGGRADKWGKPAEQEFIHRLQTLDDADRLLKAMDEIKQPLVIGASFISLEFLEIFVVNNITPAIIIRNNHFLEKILDQAGGEILQSNLERYGISFEFNDSVAEIKKHTGGKLEVTTKVLRKIECDAFAVGVGIERSVDFLKGSGIELGEKGIRVNEFLETNQEGIYAAGDVAEFYDLILEVHHVVGNWTNAFLQGRGAGLNMLGKREPFKNVTGYSITSFGFQITALGYFNKELETIVREDRTANQYERFFIKDGVLVGAALLNRFQDKSYLAKLIEKKIKIEEFKDKLRDFKFDVQNIKV